MHNCSGSSEPDPAVALGKHSHLPHVHPSTFSAGYTYPTVIVPKSRTASQRYGCVRSVLCLHGLQWRSPWAGGVGLC